MSKIENILSKLSLFEERYPGDYGLYNGKTGLTMAYYLMYSILKEDVYIEKAKNLVDDLGDNINDAQELGFENGLSGIGWGIEWLVQNKFIDANTDEILEEFDDEIYQTVVFAKSPDLSLSNGAIGKGMYFYRRLCSQNQNPSRYRTICNQECLVLLTDEMNSTLLNEDNTLYLETEVLTAVKANELAQTLLFLVTISDLKINYETTRRLICKIIGFVKMNQFIDRLKNVGLCDETLYLIYAVYKAGEYVKDTVLVKLAIEWYLLFYPSFVEHFRTSQFSNIIHNKFSILIPNLPAIEKANGNDPQLNIFNILVSINSIADKITYGWEEGWGL